jgi:hypothetical protein
VAENMDVHCVFPGLHSFAKMFGFYYALAETMTWLSTGGITSYPSII